jgi:hypothetical protein
MRLNCLSYAWFALGALNAGPPIGINMVKPG